MNELDTEQLAAIEELAGHFFKLEQIAAYLQVDPHAFVLAYAERGRIWQHYQRGKITAELEIRKAGRTLARQGSSPAQALMLKLIDEQRNAEPSL
jgi:hypothetical protein